MQGRKLFFVGWPRDYRGLIAIIGAAFHWSRAELYSLTAEELKTEAEYAEEILKFLKG